MTDARTIAARLEAGETGREIDVAIRRLLSSEDFGMAKATMTDDEVWHWLSHFGENWDNVSTSLDAAVALVERVRPGLEICLSQRRPKPGETCAEWWLASLFRFQGGYATAKAPTPAAALLAALLKSLNL